MAGVRAGYVFLDAGGVLVHHAPAEERVSAALLSLGEARPHAAIAAAVARARTVRDAGGPIDLVWPYEAEDGRVLAAARALAGDLGLPAALAGYLRDCCYHIRALELFPDAVPCLDALAARGLPAGLISNAPASLPAALHRLGVAHRLRPLLVSAEAGCSKPRPDIYREALRRAGVDAARSVFVDDLAANVEAARSLGMRAFRLVRGGAAAPGALGGLMELPALLA